MEESSKSWGKQFFDNFRQEIHEKRSRGVETWIKTHCSTHCQICSSIQVICITWRHAECAKLERRGSKNLIVNFFFRKFSSKISWKNQKVFGYKPNATNASYFIPQPALGYHTWDITPEKCDMVTLAIRKKNWV